METTPNTSAPAPVTETRTCHCCGTDYEQPLGVRGRPKMWCSADCRELMKAITRVQTLMERVDFKPTEASNLRSTLWSMCNRLNRGRLSRSAYSRKG